MNDYYFKKVNVRSTYIHDILYCYNPLTLGNGLTRATFHAFCNAHGSIDKLSIYTNKSITTGTPNKYLKKKTH